MAKLRQYEQCDVVAHESELAPFGLLYRSQFPQQFFYLKQKMLDRCRMTNAARLGDRLIGRNNVLRHAAIGIWATSEDVPTIKGGALAPSRAVMAKIMNVHGGQDPTGFSVRARQLKRVVPPTSRNDQEGESSYMKFKTILSIITACLHCVCPMPARAEPARVKQAEERPVVSFPSGVQGRQVYLKKQKTHFQNPPARIGELQKGWICSTEGNIVWSVKTYNLLTTKLSGAFRAELEKAGYPIPSISDSIFDDSKDKAGSAAELHVGMLIKEVNANFCVKDEGILGGVYMKIFWQAYAPEIQKVVFEATSEGTYQPGGTEKIVAQEFFVRAFSAAARNLLAERRFLDIVTDVRPLKPMFAAAETIRLNGVGPSNEPLAKNITALRSAVATVFGERGSGSGFFVSQDGYLLTNQHVVGNAKFVKVKLPTGRELVGEVIRSDKLRDVALVKTESIAAQPIALRSSDPNIGEDVFALGSPLGDQFNSTLTRGILSGYRTIENKRYLQSDVSILPGNSGGPLLDAQGAVVGITVGGMGAKGLAGMNFFIPIADALARLGAELN